VTKFLIHGNSPHAPTGYGVQIAQLLDSLKDDGHDPAVSVTYGLQGGVLQWNDYRLYGCGYDFNSNDLLPDHAGHWFGQESGWIITCMDVWGIKTPLIRDFNVAAWCPVDHFTAVGAQPNIREFFARSGALPVAMSRFGEDMLRRAGLDPHYVPLSVRTDVYKPTPELSNGMTGRELMDVPEDAFVVGMVAMNKGWAKDRKGFSEAFQAAGLFMAEHDNAVLFMHTEKWGGAEGQDLVELAVHSGIPEHRLKWSGGNDRQYGLRMGYTPEMMAALYSGMDVLLAPSHGEGFCVPLIEAQACGTPVIATNFAAQSELVPEGVGWLVGGQPEWDPALHGWYLCPSIADIIDTLEEAFKADRAAMVPACIGHAAQYDTRYVYETYWRPLIAELTATPEVLELDREPMPEQDAVAVLCPIYKRTENIPRLVESFKATTLRAKQRLVFVIDYEDRRSSRDIRVGRRCLSAHVHIPAVMCREVELRFRAHDRTVGAVYR
jgi:glycosyltransferase involved in cell wall biosynthesis